MHDDQLIDAGGLCEQVKRISWHRQCAYLDISVVVLCLIEVAVVLCP
jgi:hypothetical protein